jgi:NDP-sugar pyrophosphorylase family protein
MVPVGGKPVLQHQVELLVRWGAREIHILTGYLGHVIEEYFGDGRRFGLTIRYHREAKPLGTAGCVAALEGLVGESFVLLYGDIMMDMNLADFTSFHSETGSAATLAVHPNDHPHDSDLVVMDDGRRITGFIPKDRKPRWYANCVSAAAYVLSPAVFRQIPSGRPSAFVKAVFPAMLAAGEPLYGDRPSAYIKEWERQSDSKKWDGIWPAAVSRVSRARTGARQSSWTATARSWRRWTFCTARTT